MHGLGLGLGLDQLDSDLDSDFDCLDSDLDLDLDSLDSDLDLDSGVVDSTTTLKDTTDFLCKLKEITDLPDDTILATMDVASLYTNIPHDDGLRAIRNS